MRAKRLRRSGQRDRSAVSEIIGNILILGITVALFTGVMAFVSDVPEPPAPLRAEFTAELNGDILSIMHRGGSDLPASDVRITLTVEAGGGDAKIASFTHDDFTRGTSSDKWRQGSTWILDLDANAHRFPFTGDISYLHVSIAHLSLSDPLWTRLVKDDDVVQDVKISNIVVLDSAGSPHRTNWGGGMVHTINAGENYGIRVQVDSPSQTFISEVRADLSSLYGGGSLVVLTSLGGGEYRYASSVAPTAENGWYRPTIEVIGENSIVLTSESFTVLLRDKSSTEDPGVPPVDPDPEDPDPDPEEPIGPGPSNPDMINDLYFLTPQQWQSFVDSDGSINVHDTYAVSGNKIVLAFKSTAATDPRPSKQWGAEVMESPHLFIYSHRATDGASIRTIQPGMAVERVTLDGIKWNVCTIDLNNHETTALSSGGLFLKIEIKLKLTGQVGNFEPESRATAYGSFYSADKDHVRVRTLNSNNQPQVLFEIGDVIRFDVTVPYSQPTYQPSEFRATSLHDPSLDKSVAVSFLGAFGPDGRTLRFGMESFEAVTVYLSNASLFIYSMDLRYSHAGGNEGIMVAAKVYLNQTTVIESGGNVSNAINSAEGGDTIRVFEDAIDGGFEVNKPVTIYGNNTVINASTDGKPTLKISSPDADVRGFNLTAKPGWNGEDTTVVVDGAPNAKFIGNNISTHSPGGNQVRVTNSEGFVFENNTLDAAFHSNTYTIEFENSKNSRIVGNVLFGYSHHSGQINIINSDSVVIQDNIIPFAVHSNKKTINVTNSNGVEIVGNTIIDPEDPYSDDHSERIRVVGSNAVPVHDIVIRDNVIPVSLNSAAKTISVSYVIGLDIVNNTMNMPAYVPHDHAERIKVTNSESILIQLNIVTASTHNSNNVKTIRIESSQGIVIDQNEINGNNHGGQIYTATSSGVSVTNNIIEKPANSLSNTIRVPSAATVSANVINQETSYPETRYVTRYN